MRDSSVATLSRKRRTGLDYVIVRTTSAGVFAGLMESRNGQEVTLLQARRIWRWVGAASLSQLAVHGSSTPAECQFPAAVEKVLLTEAIEILYCTSRARSAIESTPEWKC